MSKFRNLMSKIVIVFAMALMFGILGNGNVFAQGDDQYTKLLMHMDDNTFKDECGHIITNNGVVTDTSHKEFGNGSGYFNKKYLSLKNNPDFLFGSEDFTIDFWVYHTDINSEQDICSMRSGYNINESYCMYFKDRKFVLQVFTDTINLTRFNTIFENNKWYHIAVIRNNTTIKLYVNGIQDSIVCDIGNKSINNSTADLLIGKNDSSMESYGNCNIDEFRISKGIARWTDNFTPPNAPYSKDIKLTATANTTSTAITLNWDKVDGATGYNVKRSTTQGSGYTTIVSNVTENTYNDTNVQAGTTYYYIVTPIINGQEGTPSNEASATANKSTETGNAILTITMTNGNVKSYTVSMTKVNDFISWYNNRSGGSNGSPYYSFDKTDSLQPFTKKTEYVVFDKISSFEVDEYSK